MTREKRVIVEWSKLPYWLQWGMIGGISGIIFVVMLYILIIYNFAVADAEFVRQGLISTLIAFFAGFIFTALFSILMHGIYEQAETTHTPKRKSKKENIEFLNERDRI